MNIDFILGFFVCYITMAVGTLSEHSTIWFYKKLDERKEHKEKKDNE